MHKLYQFKNINCGFVVICPNYNIGQIKTTVNSIKCNYRTDRYVCVLPKECHADDFKEIEKSYRVTKGGGTITSLINAGMERAPCDEWNFIVIGGTWVRLGVNKKFSTFIQDKKDILFPVIDRKSNFVDATINGILVHKEAWKEIGKMPADNPIEICKLLWANSAVEKGYKFKAIIGASLV